MKLLTQEGFDALPEGSLYSRCEQGIFSTLKIKGKEKNSEYLTQLFDGIAQLLYFDLQRTHLAVQDEYPLMYAVWGITITEPVN